MGLRLCLSVWWAMVREFLGWAIVDRHPARLNRHWLYDMRV